MKIRKLHLKNIGVFDDEEIEFKECPAKDKAEIHILTGENGTGKTTILQALASSFEDFGRIFEWHDNLNKRYHSLKNNFHKRFREDSRALINAEYLLDFADGTKGLRNRWTLISKDSHSILPHGQQSIDDFYFESISPKSRAFESAEYSFAVFAYSGQRHIESENVQAIYEPKDFNPLSQSLDFIKNYTESNQINLSQLIANNLSKQGIEYIKNNLDKAEKFRKVISIIEQIIFDITNWEMKFDLQTEPVKLFLNLNGEPLDFDVLPDGLRSLISWIADLLGRVDLLKWQDDLPITEKNLILLLDEIEVHLHPAWQRKVLPIVQKLFKNAQIFVSTHSPFVVNSVDDAWVYKLKLDESGKAKVVSVKKTENSQSVTQVLREVFDIYGLFGKEVQDKIDKFEELRDKILSNGTNTKDEKELLKIAKSLYDEPSDQVKNIIKGELQQLSEIKGKEYSI